MNPQKNQGADDAPLLRDLQLEVSQESAPLLQFMLRHAWLIAGVLVLFLLVLAGMIIGFWNETVFVVLIGVALFQLFTSAAVKFYYMRRM